jgi:hypothetical protein
VSVLTSLVATESPTVGCITLCKNCIDLFLVNGAVSLFRGSRQETEDGEFTRILELGYALEKVEWNVSIGDFCAIAIGHQGRCYNRFQPLLLVVEWLETSSQRLEG